jgi:hypothetical protein
MILIHQAPIPLSHSKLNRPEITTTNYALGDVSALFFYFILTYKLNRLT